MFWYSKRHGRLTKWCKACLWADQWRKINGRRFFSKTAESHLNEIYNFLGSEERIETFIHEIEHAVRQKTAKNYNYVAIRLGRSIEFLTFVLCDFHSVNADEMSKNIINAAKEGKKKNLHLTTLTGFSRNSELSRLSNISLWVNSKAYNIIENTHQIWLLIVCDMLVGKTVYSSR